MWPSAIINFLKAVNSLFTFNLCIGTGSKFKLTVKYSYCTTVKQDYYNRFCWQLWRKNCRNLESTAQAMSLTMTTSTPGKSDSERCDVNGMSQQLLSSN